VNFFAGEVHKVDAERKQVIVSHGFDHHHHELPYDHIVFGLGSITNFYNLPGLEAHALTMKTLGDAIHLRNRLIALLEEADTECCAGKRVPLLTFVVAGGGFAGVETIAAINDFARHALRFYPRLREHMLRVVLVHPGEFILPELGAKLGAYAQQKLAERKVEIRVNTKVLGASARGVELSDGEYIATNTLIWTAGTSPNPLLASIDCEKDRGRLLVDDTMQAKGLSGVWALGDCALIPDRKTGTYYPPTAQHALREGRVLAHNLLAAVDRRTLKPAWPTSSA
jgi:NADH dehydrogenase